MRVTIVGTGYVGLVSGACFADFGHHVTCVDKDAAKIAALRRNEIPIYEPGLDHMVETNTREGRLDFTADLQKPVADADAVSPSARPRAAATATRTCPMFTQRRARSLWRSPALLWSSPSRRFQSGPATMSSASSAKSGRPHL